MTDSSISMLLIQEPIAMGKALIISFEIITTALSRTSPERTGVQAMV